MSEVLQLTVLCVSVVRKAVHNQEGSVWCIFWDLKHKEIIFENSILTSEVNIFLSSTWQILHQKESVITWIVPLLLWVTGLFVSGLLGMGLERNWG